jgi:predicted ATPase
MLARELLYMRHGNIELKSKRNKGMIINKIEIENFKCFGEKTSIKFAPLTLIYGENGAGKSAILQAIRLLVNSLTKRDGAYPVSHREITDALPFATISHEGNNQHEICVSMEYLSKFRSRISTKYAYAPEGGTGELIQLDVDGEISVEKWRNSFIEKLYQYLKAHRQDILDGYARLIELSLMQKFYMQNAAARNDIIAAAGSGLVEDDNPLHSYWDANLVKTRFAEGLEEWITFGIPGWIEYRNSKEYSVARDATLFIYKDCLDFFNSDFLVEDISDRYGADISNLTNLIVKGQQPSGDIFNTFLFIREIVLLSSPQIHLKARANIEYVIACKGLPIRVEKTGFYMIADAASMRQIMESLLNGSPSRIPLNPDDVALLLAQSMEENTHYAMSQIQDSFSFLPPIREMPKTAYTIDSIIGQLAKDVSGRRRLNSWLGKLGTGYEIEFSDGSESGKGNSLLLYDTKSNRTPVSIAETGFGFSQVLPIVLACTPSDSKCILIEEPELHIHPRLQAELGSLFADAYLENKHQIIAETHSEHLMLRVQRLIRTGVLNADDVCVLYVSRAEDGSTVQELRLDQDGESLDLWPSGFFPDRTTEIIGGKV